MAEKEIFYEMLWDCTQCETKGLLGDSHRHCPTCGAAQDPTKRYFPKPGEEVEAKDHQFVGADWSCGYCNTPNSNAAAHCTNCGAGKDGTQPVSTLVDTLAVPVAATAAAPAAPKSGWMRWVLGLVVVAVVAMIAMFSITKETTATVSQRTWFREIQIEKLSPVSESAWCDGVPADAYSVSRTREQRSSKKISDGQDCHEERVDKGDGTFVKRRECTPRYREEPIYDNRCHFQVNRWRTARSVKAGAETSSALMPVWPSVGNLYSGSGGSNLSMNGLGGTRGLVGAEREGPRRENYTLTLASGGKTWTCSVNESVWRKYEDGSTTPIKVRLTGGADCDSLK